MSVIMIIFGSLVTALLAIGIVGGVILSVIAVVSTSYRAWNIEWKGSRQRKAHFALICLCAKCIGSADWWVLWNPHLSDAQR
jgi:hypothetical protein